MSYLNNDDSLKRYKEKMGEDLGELYNAIKNIALELQLKYQKYIALFGSAKSVEALYKFAPGFFYYIQNILFDDLILHINKLFADPGSGNKKVLCFNCLLEKITDEEELKENIKKILDVCNKKKVFTDIRRNKYIAHTDYHLFLGKEEYDISINPDDIKEMIDHTWEIIDCIEYFYFKACTINHVYQVNLDFEKLLKNINHFYNNVGLKKIIDIECKQKGNTQ